MKWLLPLPVLLLVAASANCQTLMLNGGASSLLQGSGGRATMYLPNSTLSTSVGYHDGHFLVGASDTFLIDGFKTTVGDAMLGFSFDGVGLGLSLKGVSATRVWKEQNDCARLKPTRSGPMGYLGTCHKGTTSVTAFVGATGVGFFSPFVSTTRAQHIGSGVLLQYSVKNLVLSSLDVVEGGKHTLAQGTSYSSRSIRLAGSGGLLNSQKYFSGSAVFQPIRAWSLYTAHQSYFLPYAAKSNSVGTSLTVGRFNGSATLNESASLGRKITGENFGVGLHVGPVREQSAYYKSGQSQTILVHTITETMRHWTLTQAINQSIKGNSYSFGGGYSSNKVSFFLTRSMQFIIGRGYQQETGVGISLRIHDTGMTAQTITDQFGKTQYVAYIESYVQTGLQTGGHEARSRRGKFLLEGKCVLPDGSPVEGCAVVIDKETVYSNSRGEFSIRMKKRNAVTVSVPVTDFAAPVDWNCLECPTSTAPGEPVTIIVARR